jgi:UDP-glucose 4-epimerase
MQNILLTGGTGYIAAHTAITLIEQGYNPILLDNFVNSSPKIVPRIAEICGKTPSLIELDILDTQSLTQVMRTHNIHAVIHFAALKAVGESVARPLAYYHNNVAGLLSVLNAMQAAKVAHIVLSSSATVYSEDAKPPFVEDAPLAANSPYGQTKVMMERIINDIAHTDPNLRFAMLRYFNPVGAHPSGLIGEHPNGIPNNLMPYIQQVAIGQRDYLSVWGNDYDTTDGTGERDYIHVMDLADGHVLALAHLLKGEPSFTVNLGSGEPVSVLQLVRTFEMVTGQTIPYKIAPRRAGDVAILLANPQRAKDLLGFSTKRTTADMCADAWRWQKNNPSGFSS